MAPTQSAVAAGRGADDRGSAAPWVVLAVLLVVPVLALTGWWLVAEAENPTRAAATVEAVLAPVVQQDVRAEASVTVALGDAPGREVASGASGTVTSAPQVGAVLEDGAEALRVDDRPVRAMSGSAPPWRALQSGDKGADVTRLQEYLTALGYYSGTADGVFGASLRRAVERFNADGGLGARVGGFDPSTVVWIGPAPLTVAEPLVGEGVSVGPGVPVLRGPSTPRSVVVTEPQGGIGAAGEFGGSASLTVGQATVGYVPGSGAITAPADVEAVRAALAPATEGAARVAAAEPRRVLVVPASSLVQGQDGSICVYGSLGGDPVLVEPVGGGVGSAQLPLGLTLTEVLSNPGRVAPDVPCGL